MGMRELMLNALKTQPVEKEKPVFDMVGADMSGADTYTDNDVALKTVASIQQWVEMDDMEDGESCADRLMAMMIGIADANKDGEISDDEQELVDLALNSAWDYLSKYGVSDDDISSLLNDWDVDAAERIRDLLASALPEGDAADADMDDFVFGAGDQEAALDATYKKKVVVRGGKKVRINKRISGTVRLSARQKMAIRKALMKSHSAVAQMRRKKSMKVRKRSGL